MYFYVKSFNKVISLLNNTILSAIYFKFYHQQGSNK
jgi:hypothetical protein